MIQNHIKPATQLMRHHVATAVHSLTGKTASHAPQSDLEILEEDDYLIVDPENKQTGNKKMMASFPDIPTREEEDYVVIGHESEHRQKFLSSEEIKKFENLVAAESHHLKEEDKKLENSFNDTSGEDNILPQSHTSGSSIDIEKIEREFKKGSVP